MRISFYQVLIAIICTTMAEAREGVAQNVLNQKLSVQSNNQSVESILHKLEKLSDVRFLYNPQIFSANSTATISAKNESLDLEKEYDVSNYFYFRISYQYPNFIG